MQPDPYKGPYGWKAFAQPIGVVVTIVLVVAFFWWTSGPSEEEECEAARAYADMMFSGADRMIPENKPKEYVEMKDAAAEAIVESPECFSQGELDGARWYLDAPEGTP